LSPGRIDAKINASQRVLQKNHSHQDDLLVTLIGGQNTLRSVRNEVKSKVCLLLFFQEEWDAQGKPQ
jgi:hypothetical protein